MCKYLLEFVTIMFESTFSSEMQREPPGTLDQDDRICRCLLKEYEDYRLIRSRLENFNIKFILIDDNYNDMTMFKVFYITVICLS